MFVTEEDLLLKGIRFDTDEGGGGSGNDDGNDDSNAADDGSNSSDDGGNSDASADSNADGNADGNDDGNAGDRWGDSWRENYVNSIKDKDGNPLDDDAKKKLAGRLGRYSSPAAVMDAMISAQNKISSGDMRMTLPDGASKEEIAEFRKQNNIPEKPEDYDTTLTDGLVIGEDDKEQVDSFLKMAHDANMPQDVVKNALNFYFSMHEQQVADQASTFAAYKQEGIEELRSEWGGNYNLNLSAAINFMNSAPGEIPNILANAIGGDGMPLASNPEVLKWFTDIERKRNPISTVVPNQGDEALNTIETEIADIKKLMGDPNSEYWKKGSKLPGRFVELTDALNAAKKVAA